MSTVDPSYARAARQARRPGTTRVVVLLVVLFAGGVLMGWGWGGFALIGEDAEPPVGAVVGAVGGLILSVAGFAGWTATVLRRSDVGLGYGAAAELFGGGAGLMAVLQGTQNVVALGIAWALFVLGALFLVLGVSAAAARRRQDSRDERIMESGMLTTATVSDKGYDFFHESSRILTTVTFTFTDLQGTQRWVQKTVLIEQSAPIMEGQETRLWYDAANPGDTRSIVVELARANALRR
ncbi:hypothetical protein IT072_14790 [Leifsonia sp. ZF2019]|uniref:DUF3592 domain-containing protein n=1 Tax=Leifsonia sp. ZF2019 TaxID=2781978 RepID=UPI001CC090EC|nr:DUF3592 domain-containing protein [Leifsonia sp. ZF2019]UAJ78509.1 hypothetical protein IT072_14790 [Leifsonia sp. ZF2019]